VLPELAPCYVATATRWSWAGTREPRARARASRASRATVARRPATTPARLDLDLALIQRADDLLARAFPARRAAALAVEPRGRVGRRARTARSRCA
jgi:hypothetical protein